ncbi:MAG: DUF4276 family protein [Gemmatimonadota bacterium]|nr:DUF4276 family protein [Gemmatimonadota bacterium]
MSAVIYIEGGGDNRRLGAEFRQGWKAFLTNAGLSGRMPKVVRGGSRKETFDRFSIAIADPTDDTVPLLLVDSEGPVAVAHSVWQHLQASDGWRKPDTARDDQAFLMVQVMESWFLADRKALQTYFGERFMTNAIRRWPRLEELPKETVFDVLEKATAGCSRPYSKGKVASELLAGIDPRLVQRACPHAKSLLDRLRAS